MNTTPTPSARVAAVVAALACAAFAGAAQAAPTGPAPFAGGSPVPAGSGGFVAGLRTPGTTHFFCTGSLVSPNWVLTAAHCADNGAIEVVVGDTNLNDSADAAEQRAVDRVVVNPRWGGDTGDKYDVALLHLTSPSTLPTVEFGVSPALVKGAKRCVQQRLVIAPWNSPAYLLPCQIGAGTAFGWGRTPKSGNQTSSTLNQAKTRIFDLGPRAFWRVKAGACPGDSGGPLMVQQPDGRLTQIGVASYAQHGGGWFDWLVGDRCSTKGWDYYADVSGGDTLTWIQRVLSPPPPVTPAPPPPSGPRCPNPTKPTCVEP